MQNIDNQAFRIVVADDEESLRSIVSEVLIEQGYRVETASNGKQALEKVQAGGVHVVITDIRMPEMTGLELLEQVKKHDSAVEVIIMTSYASIDSAIKAIRLGAYDYLTKPFEDLNIIPTVVDRTVGKIRLEIAVKKLLAELKLKNDQMHKLYQHSSNLLSTLKVDEIIKQAELALHDFAPNSRIQFEKFASMQELQKHLQGPVDQQQLRLPVMASKEYLGLFSVRSEQPLPEEIRELLRQYIGNASTHAEKATLHATVESLAVRDGLTELYNRRYFQQSMTHELERAKRFNNKLSILLFDVDHFKHYNDTNGHQQGDYLLKELAQLFQNTSRNIDICCRYGGEEFVAILLSTGIDGAQVRAEKLKQAIAAHRFTAEEKQPMGKISVSGGYAEYPTHGSTAEELIEAADKALYASKSSGRNRMTSA